MKRDNRVASPNAEQSKACEYDKEKQQTKCVVPRYTNTCFVIEEDQFETKKRSTAVDEVSTHGLTV